MASEKIILFIHGCTHPALELWIKFIGKICPAAQPVHGTQRNRVCRPTNSACILWVLIDPSRNRILNYLQVLFFMRRLICAYQRHQEFKVMQVEIPQCRLVCKMPFSLPVDVLAPVQKSHFARQYFVYVESTEKNRIKVQFADCLKSGILFRHRCRPNPKRTAKPQLFFHSGNYLRRLHIADRITIKKQLIYHLHLHSR